MNQVPNLIKVGQTSVSLEKRRRELNTGNPYRLQIVAAWQVKDKKLGERVAHSYLDNDPSYERARLKYSGGREWFIVEKGGLHKVYNGIEQNLVNSNLFVKRVI